MERLTFLNGDEIPCVRNDQCFEEQSEHYCGPAIDRLAAYEDTRLMPEEVLPKEKADEIALNLMRFADLEEFAPYDRLRELAEADKTGRVVVLPCKVGDVVYGFYGEKTILPMVAKWIETNTDGWCIAAQYTPMAPMFYRFSDFGKTVFLTREEAEEALEGIGNG